MIDLSPSNWQLKINQNIGPISSRPAFTKFPPRFRSRLIRVSASARSTSRREIPENWRRAGYISQRQRGHESFNEIVPVNQSAIFVLPILQTIYQLAFKPVPSLPNVRLRIWEYRDRDPEGLGVLGVEPGPLQISQIQQQLQELPQQFIDAANENEWNWRDQLPEE